MQRFTFGDGVVQFQFKAEKTNSPHPSVIAFRKFDLRDILLPSTDDEFIQTEKIIRSLGLDASMQETILERLEQDFDSTLCK